MIYLYWIGGVFLWMLIGSIVLGVDNAITEPKNRVLDRSSTEIGFILFGMVIWPLILFVDIAQLTSECVVHIREKPDESKYSVDDELVER